MPVRGFLPMGREYLSLPQVVSFIDHFGLPGWGNESFFEAITQLNPRFQGGRDLVRFQLEKDERNWSKESIAAIMAAAEAFEMMAKEWPLFGDFDMVIAMGGARFATIDRASYAAKAISEGQTNAQLFLVAGSTRPVSQEEWDIVYNTYSPPHEASRTEATLCREAAMKVSREFKIQAASAVVNQPKAGNWEVLEYALEVFRNNMTYSPLSVAAVTTQIYRVALQLDLQRLAKAHGLESVAAIGCPSRPGVAEKRTPATYFSEVLRAIGAAALAARKGV